MEVRWWLMLSPLMVDALAVLGVFANFVPEVGPSSGGTKGKENAIAHGEGLDLHLANWTSLAI
ncbi:MAG: hypothetical protein HLUCCO16_19400 [Phormidium sp. OSCR]|nr:MAG: hypothetical protein HLUCCO16_19400 [Phormidium sp. OSCR]